MPPVEQATNRAPAHSPASPEVPLSRAGKNIVPRTPATEDAMIHHVLSGALYLLKRGRYAESRNLLEAVLDLPTSRRWIYHAMAAFYLAQLTPSADAAPDLDLLEESFRANPVFPDSLALLVEHAPERAESLVQEVTGLSTLPASGFLRLLQSGLWVDLVPYWDNDNTWRGKTIFDFGARTGFHGLVFLALGASRYTAVDKAEKSYRQDFVKNHLAAGHPRMELGFTMLELAGRHGDRLNLIRVDKYRPAGERFDVVTLFATSEHLMEPDDVFRKLRRVLAPGGRLLMNHHNFFTWNGHHNRPKTVEEYHAMAAAGEDLSFADWNFFGKEITNTYLNRLTLDELRRELEKQFSIRRWDHEWLQLANGLERFSVEVLKRHPDKKPEDFLTQQVIVEAGHTDEQLRKLQRRGSVFRRLLGRLRGR